MRWKNTALISRSGGHEEIKGFVFFIVSRLLDQAPVNDAACRRIHEPSICVFNKEPLSDPFVDNYECHLRRLGLVIVFTDSLCELRNFLRKTDVTLCVTKTVSVNDEVSGVFTLVIASEARDRILECLFHLRLDNLLTLLLKNELRVVLAHLLIV